MRREIWRGLLMPALALAILTGTAFGQDDVRKLDKTFRDVARKSIPKTVGIKSYVSETGDKAGYGTGAILSADGYIATCSHVIDIAKRIEVVLPNKKVYKATLLGKNPKQDYALLKIEAENLPFFKIGDSAAVEMGEWVVALGHPGGPYADQQPAFAAGRVTGLHRKLPVQFMQRYYNDAIQTDCPIFAGNSGGPLINLEGELIGLNGAILMINDNSYALPIQQVTDNMLALKAGKVIEGEAAGPEAFAEMQKHMRPEDMEKMQKQMMERFSKMFGGGKDGENPLGDLFKMFGGKDGENPLKDLFGGNGENPLKDLFGGKGGEGLDMNKLMEQFGKMFGGENGEDMDLGKLFEKFGKMFGENGPGGKGGNPFGDLFGGNKPKPQQPAPRARANATRRGGYLGMVPASDSDSQNLGGVLVGGIVKDGPAKAADLRKGDIVISVNGKATPDVWSLRQAVNAHGAGETIKMTVIRPRLLDTVWVREKTVINVTLGKRQ